MNVRRWLGPSVIVATLALSGAVQPLVDQARAAGPASTPVPKITNLSGGLGAEDPQQITADQAKGYGPVNQAAPLDFSTQPKTVPHEYVPGRLYNVQVYTKYSYAQLVGQMTYFASSLGVQCTYCHNAQNYAYDTSTKKAARLMAKMVVAANAQYIDPVHKAYPNYAVSGAVGCVTCHRGQPRMAVQYNVVPVQYLDYRYKNQKQAGYTVNSMYGVARSLGVNCLFCHNTADFISLQYYPTNQIAHRMWRMVDAINHEYLPANIKAVTCYTCHQGAKWPTRMVTAALDQTPVDPKAAHPEVHENPGAHLASGAQP